MKDSEIGLLLAKSKSRSWCASTMDREELMALPRGEIAITIDRNGEWSYRCEPFKRESMVLMLSQSLVRIEDDYFLIAPEQRLAITVEDLPFVTTKVSQSSDRKKIKVSINNRNQFEIGLEHPLCLQKLPDSSQQIPVVNVRDNLLARFSRSCYYQLAEWAFEASVDGRQSACIESNNKIYSIGASS